MSTTETSPDRSLLSKPTEGEAVPVPDGLNAASPNAGTANASVETLRLTEPHFVRCVKPNAEKVSDEFTSALVLSQLRYSGLLEVCRIRQNGFPNARNLKGGILAWSDEIDPTVPKY